MGYSYQLEKIAGDLSGAQDSPQGRSYSAEEVRDVGMWHKVLGPRKVEIKSPQSDPGKTLWFVKWG